MSRQTVQFRATDDDTALLEKLMAKLGISASAVLRIAIRRLAELEKIVVGKKA